jgi:hypothetical protein
MHFGGAVPLLSVLRRAIDLDELGEVAAVVQRGSDGRAVRRESIGSHLERPARGRVAHAFDELVGCRLVPLTHCDVEHELAVPLDGDERVAVPKVLIVLGAHPLFLLADEAPHFVGFHVTHLDVDDPLRHDALGLLACQHQQFQDGGVVNLGDPLDTGDTVAFEHETQNHLRLLDGQVHAF